MNICRGSSDPHMWSDTKPGQKKKWTDEAAGWRLNAKPRATLYNHRVKMTFIVSITRWQWTSGLSVYMIPVTVIHIYGCMWVHGVITTCNKRWTKIIYLFLTLSVCQTLFFKVKEMFQELICSFFYVWLFHLFFKQNTKCLMVKIDTILVCSYNMCSNKEETGRAQPQLISLA